MKCLHFTMFDYMLDSTSNFADFEFYIWGRQNLKSESKYLDSTGNTFEEVVDGTCRRERKCFDLLSSKTSLVSNSVFLRCIEAAVLNNGKKRKDNIISRSSLLWETFLY